MEKYAHLLGLKRLALWRRADRPEICADRHYDRDNHVRSLRKFVEFLDQRHSNVSIVGLLTHTVMETISVAFYVWTSQVTAATSVTEFTWNLPVFVVEVVLNIIFLLTWGALFFFEQDKKAYLISWLSLVNAMTSVPMIVIGCGAIRHSRWRSGWVPMYLRVWWIHDCLIVLIDYPIIAQYMVDMWREMVRFFIHVFAVLCTCIGTHQIVESCSGHYMDLYDSLYMMVVAFGTIGYGDVCPLTTPARIFMIVFLIIGISFFLPMFQRLASIAERNQFYNTFQGGESSSWWLRGWRHPHVIICGQFSDLGVDLLLKNFYAGWRMYLDTCVVLMSPEEHSAEVRLTANLPWLKGRVTLMVGDPANSKDLARARAREADAIFLFGNTRSSAYYQDYTAIAQSMAVSLYDRDLPQHILLRRNRTVKQIAPFAASVLECERMLHHLLGLSMAHPGVVPLVVNLLRTYESLPMDTTLSRHWVEQYEHSLRNDLYGLEIPDALRGREFRLLARAFSEKDVTLIGILNVRNVVQLNPRELIPNAKKLLLIAKTIKVAQEATNSISRNYEHTFGEEMLVAPDLDEHDRCKRRLMRIRRHSALSDEEEVASAPKKRNHEATRGTQADATESPSTTRTASFGSVNSQQQQQQHQHQHHQSPTHTERDRESHSVFAPSERPAHSIFCDKQFDQDGDSDEEFEDVFVSSPLAPHPAVSSTSLGGAQSPVFSDTAPARAVAGELRTESNVPSLIHVSDAFDFENHFILIDLSSAKAKDKSSRYAQEAASTATANDIFQVMAPVRQAYPMNDVVLLTNDVSFAPYFDYFWNVHKQDTTNPAKYITGCGLNTADLRRCNLKHCAGCCIFFAGDVSRYGSTSAMSMLVVLSINEIMQGIPPFPVVVELEGLANLSLFPPHADDPRLRAKALVDFVYEPNFVMGNAISRIMLFPALQRTYFMEEFIDVIDVLISGHSPDVPALARLPLTLCEVELETYEDVVTYCLKFGFLPIALQRRIVDLRNPSINGQRFVLTNPPRALPVMQQSDVLFYITPGN
ncbi:putative calcium/potassium channel (CAKC) [Leptomonas seymouri]|uniref:Putative calcium/potassium channel (CAKC) n=1 Tax=Leptomonas seymouri TaxID=5684 RepID=A0A0N1IH19_LEPSE|nr:putative calcium/potassium channel (CAKC) [Leptomonas seymouri]|eukprot:KPI83424.1 putative calcium/potassium channel (CAKC) [Leptomonas seymouri]